MIDAAFDLIASFVTWSCLVIRHLTFITSNENNNVDTVSEEVEVGEEEASIDNNNNNNNNNHNIDTGNEEEEKTDKICAISLFNNTGMAMTRRQLSFKAGTVTNLIDNEGANTNSVWLFRHIMEGHKSSSGYIPRRCIQPIINNNNNNNNLDTGGAEVEVEEEETLNKRNNIEGD